MGQSLPRSNQLASLDDEALVHLARAGEPFEIAAGNALFRQGMPADALYLVAQGRLEIATRIPGDETTVLSAILPGEVVGEFALLDDGPRSASVIAVEPTSGVRLSRTRFAPLLADGHHWARALIDALRRLVASRCRATIDGIVAADRYDRASLRAAGSGRAAQEVEAGDLGLLLAAAPRLTALAEQGQEMAASGIWLGAARGSIVAQAGTDPDHLLLVLRGALRTAIARPGGVEQLAVHGPGEFVGAVALFDGGGQPLLVEAAEESLLFAIERPCFDALRTKHSPLGHVLFEALGRQLVRDQRRANRHLGRVVALERFNSAGVAGDV